MRRSHRSSHLLLVLLASCSSLRYDLTSLPYQVSATPTRDPALTGTPFELQAKAVLWCHGLFGDDQPDVAAMVQEQCGTCDGVADFRVGAAASFHDWLINHLTLGFVRMKTVTIRGTRLTRTATTPTPP